jgi:hypothetical protein
MCGDCIKKNASELADSRGVQGVANAAYARKYSITLKQQGGCRHA